jgi:hypothetical protein
LWLALIIGLEQGLVIHIDNRDKQRTIVTEYLKEEPAVTEFPASQPVEVKQTSTSIHPDRVNQSKQTREISTTPTNLTDDQRVNQILEKAERFIEESE